MSVGVLRSLGPACGGSESSCDILLIGCLLTGRYGVPSREGPADVGGDDDRWWDVFQTMAK